MCLQYHWDKGACGHDFEKEVMVLCDAMRKGHTCVGVADMGRIPSMGTDQLLKDCPECKESLPDEVDMMIEISKHRHPESENLRALERVFRNIYRYRDIFANQKRALMAKVLNRWMGSAQVYDPRDEYHELRATKSWLGGPIRSYCGTAESFHRLWETEFPGYYGRRLEQDGLPRD